MQVFEKDYELTYSHIDWRGVSRPSAVFDFMQDAAPQHARFCHLDRDDIGAKRLRLSLALKTVAPAALITSKLN